jgi:hypothetical protein
MKLVSIVVATKDRYDTLFDCIRGLLLNYGGDEVEIVVRDNSARPQTQRFVDEFGRHGGVVYHHDPVPVSQSENYELAVAAASGRYVTMIGDDDGVAQGLIAVARWMEQHAIDAFFPGFSVYLWPGVAPRLARANATGSLSLNRFEPPRRVSAAAQRNEVLEAGATTLALLPRLYYGLVARRVLGRLREAAGACFPGPSPDMANAFALSYLVQDYRVAQLPLFIAGNSRASNAGLGLRARHVGEIGELPFLPTDTVARWNPDIPFFWSGQTIWCQSAHAAAQALGRGDEFAAGNDFRHLYARLLVFQPRYLRRTWTAFAHHWRPGGAARRTAEAVAVAGQAAALLAQRALSFAARRGRAAFARADTAAGDAPPLPGVCAATRAVDAAMARIDLKRWLDDPGAGPSRIGAPRQPSQVHP